jgi:hypothetical protein
VHGWTLNAAINFGPSRVVLKRRLCVHAGTLASCRRLVDQSMDIFKCLKSLDGCFACARKNDEEFVSVGGILRFRFLFPALAAFVAPRFNYDVQRCGHADGRRQATATC